VLYSAALGFGWFVESTQDRHYVMVKNASPASVRERADRVFAALVNVDEYRVPDPSISSASAEFDDETRQHLQRRLMLVFTVLAGVSAFYAVGPFIAAFATGQPLSQSARVPLFTVLIALGNGALALRCYRGQRNLRELWVLDAAASAVTCWMIAASISQVRPRTRPRSRCSWASRT
jgi:hypothetical protein